MTRPADPEGDANPVVLQEGPRGKMPPAAPKGDEALIATFAVNHAPISGAKGGSRWGVGCCLG